MARTPTIKQGWAIAAHFRRIAPRWALATASYELFQTLVGQGRKWLVFATIHAISSTCPRSRVEFRSSLTLWQASSPAPSGERVSHGGWYGDVETLLRRAGYGRGWERSPHGIFGDFWKNLRTLENAHREARTLVTIMADLARLSKSAGG